MESAFVVDVIILVISFLVMLIVRGIFSDTKVGVRWWKRLAIFLGLSFCSIIAGIIALLILFTFSDQILVSPHWLILVVTISFPALVLLGVSIVCAIVALVTSIGFSAKDLK